MDLKSPRKHITKEKGSTAPSFISLFRSLLHPAPPFFSSGRRSDETYSSGIKHFDFNLVILIAIVELLQKWQSVTLGPKGDEVPSDQPHTGISPAISKRLRRFNTCDSDEDGCQSPEPPHDIPKGYMAVYVGPELRRFVIPTSYLSDPVFKVLLDKVEEEFGFDHSGALTIPCEIETFKYLLKVMETHQDDHPEEDNTAGTSVAVEE
ncbi:hypothetical protein Vadar_026980 [Vaccinium darrowii]|uniref:Uncharacterized protein n=1 Tax=Vaccinium darrowii TaxID=229202 RepID=A0ACB7YG23_9ERIC|nr:hypothetical protein Vadar_026980 [Vaccinium darrowii]